jgi:hypothetical protein
MHRVYSQSEAKSLYYFDSQCGRAKHALIDGPHSCSKRGMLSGKQGEKLMPAGMFRSEEGWVQVDYDGTGNIPIPRSKYEENKYKPDFDKLPTEVEYLAAEKKKEDNAKGS